MEPLDLAGRLTGPGHPPYVIAEIGANHNGDMRLCRAMIREAARCGADAVKFQSWTAESLISSAEFGRNAAYSDPERHFGSLKEMVERYQLSAAQHREVAAYCRELGVHFMSTPFSPAEVDLLAELGVPALKIASMDVTHPELLKYAAQTGLPIILSTGMASLAEVGSALETLQQHGSGGVALLHCISIYPPDYEDIHLRNIPMLGAAFGVPVGFSDHSFGTAIPLAAVALGACILEKHFTTDKTLQGWDHLISADPPEMEAICREAKNVFTALGHAHRTVSPAELEKRDKFRRCVVLKRDVAAGETLTGADLDYKRPGTGIAPTEAPYVVGRRAARDLVRDHELAWSDLA